jgi:hypothetical protein
MIAHGELFWPIVIALAVVVSVHLLAMWRLFRQMPDDPNIADLTDAEMVMVEEERIRELTLGVFRKKPPKLGSVVVESAEKKAKR